MHHALASARDDSSGETPRPSFDVFTTTSSAGEHTRAACRSAWPPPRVAGGGEGSGLTPSPAQAPAVENAWGGRLSGDRARIRDRARERRADEVLEVGGRERLREE